jgi:flagellar motor switch protein FliG
MPEDDSNLTGSQRAAVFLLSLGEESAAKVLKYLEPREVQAVGKAMTEITSVDKDKLNGVVDSFLHVAMEGTSMGTSPTNYVKRTLTEALGESRGSRMINRILKGSDNSAGLDSLKWMDTESVAALLRNEHPQICAIMLSSLDSDHAAEVLNLLPEDVVPDVMMRIANLDQIQPQALAELDEIVQNQLEEQALTPASKVEGVSVAANIMGFLDSEMEAKIFEEIQNSNAERALEIRDKMFIFEDLLLVSDMDMQRLCRDIDDDKKVVALKGATDEMLQKFLKGMSKQQGEILIEELEIKGPVKLKEVEDVQKEILTISQKLAEEGEIVIMGRGKEEYV